MVAVALGVEGVVIDVEYALERAVLRLGRAYRRD
ncbi:hypothetical protein CLV40_104331 [Actinokineospora auranticolor]|uniref:Uncharacterized protein n=1 Tax=Actinokineospora auranticolor TaxID=155976 RepID=A0A2S6GV42_9PSEU|nr:hypothetical protein CLV40_104331 [Actinokineospora auranticolor]